MLKHIGIEKASPTAQRHAIFRRAIMPYYMQQRYLTVEPEELYWPDRRWRNVFYSDPNMGFSLDYERSLVDTNSTATVDSWGSLHRFPEAEPGLVVHSPRQGQGR